MGHDSAPPDTRISQPTVRANVFISTDEATAAGAKGGASVHLKLASEVCKIYKNPLSVSIGLVKGKALKFMELEIVDVSYGGLGVGRLEGRVVFVPYTVTGDRVTVEIVTEKKNYLFARAVGIDKPSPWRVNPLCPYFGVCGGCQLAHVAYRHQLVVKQKQVKEIFQRLGKIPDVWVEDTLPSPQEWHYRCKMEFHAGSGEAGRRVLGMQRARSHEIVEIERCLLAHESINRALEEARKEGFFGRITFWAEDNGRAPFIRRTVKGETFLVPRGAFFQANMYLVDTLVDIVLSLSAIEGTGLVIDAYCGVGLFSVFLARQASKVLGIEINREAAKMAQRQGQFEVIHGDVYAVLRHLSKEIMNKVEVLVVDPPRVGLKRNVLMALSEIRPKKIVYVSCNPSTMARDSLSLSQIGYRLTRLIPIDMFPQTAHIEVVGRWDLVN